MFCPSPTPFSPDFFLILIIVQIPEELLSDIFSLWNTPHSSHQEFYLYSLPPFQWTQAKVFPGFGRAGGRGVGEDSLRVSFEP